MEYVSFIKNYNVESRRADEDQRQVLDYCICTSYTYSYTNPINLCWLVGVGVNWKNCIQKTARV